MSLANLQQQKYAQFLCKTTLAIKASSEGIILIMLISCHTQLIHDNVCLMSPPNEHHKKMDLQGT